MQEQKRKGRGGPRPGSGRKPTGRLARRALMVYLTDDVATRLDERLKATGEKKTAFVRGAIVAALDDKQGDDNERI